MDSDLVSILWSQDRRTATLIGIVVASGVVGYVTVYLPLAWRVAKLASVRRRVHRAMRLQEDFSASARQAVEETLSASALSPQWALFSKRWRDSQGSNQRAPVRFLDSLEERPIIPAGWRRSMLAALPGVFLGLGIFGTFVGLTLAAGQVNPGAREPSTQEITTKIESLTASLGLAFRTSLWGLLLSMTSSLMIRRLEGRLESEEQDLDALVHRAFDFVSQDELAALAIKEQRDSADRLRTELTNVSMDLQNVLAAGLEQINEATSSTAQQVSEQLVQQLGTALTEGVSAHVEALRQAIERTARVQDEIGEGLALAFEQMREVTAAHNATVDRLREASGAVGEASEKLGQTSASFAPTVEQLRAAGSTLENTSRAMAETQQRAGEAVEAVRGTLDDARRALDQQRELVEGSLGEMRQAIERLSQGLSDDLRGALEGVDSILGDALQRIGGTILESNETLDRMGPALGQVFETVRGVEGAVGRVGTSMEGVGTRLERDLEPLAEATRKLVEIQSEVLPALSSVRDAMEQAARQAENLGGRFGAETSPLRDAVGDLAQRLDSYIGRMEQLEQRRSIAPTPTPQGDPPRARRFVAPAREQVPETPPSDAPDERPSPSTVNVGSAPRPNAEPDADRTQSDARKKRRFRWLPGRRG